ncbi:DUF5994 family protein [[Mycobacterium] wendilense]|uniref:DUF5994 family protein n=1 Tax=[Mycobacterium] wendilense TaxID=3064284 RepID=A0ABN9NY78_9MYCO|nr:DUF5994 family protein [Mycolicibacterium sp. MU0050]CAJ1582525.1 DUF5994 family protein [Mycolicibacterium sp. MU0050]
MRAKNVTTRGRTVPGARATPAPAKVAGDARRLALSGSGSAHGCVDGAWWPKTADLRSELPDLVAVFSRWIGSIHRIVYDPVLWEAAPSRLIKHGSAISVDPYRMVNRETIGLMGTHSRSAVLFVVAPSTSGAIANKMFDLVERSNAPVAATMLQQRYAEYASAAMSSDSMPDGQAGPAPG